tara:strand:+ start:635 stop:820 length:186 start_codon:yes stop_codon:yes gene_type:complete
MGTLRTISFLIFGLIVLPANLPLNAGGCSLHKNKKAEIECKLNDEDCIKNKSKVSLNNFKK